MTREELAAQIAEKVWGWDLKPHRLGKADFMPQFDGKLYWYKPGDDWPYEVGNPESYLEKYDIQSEVFSWEGFGRTVEAMKNKHWIFNCHEGDDACFIQLEDYERNKPMKSSKDGYDLIGDRWDELSDSQALIEATHRAALEAIGDE